MHQLHLEKIETYPQSFPGKHRINKTVFVGWLFQAELDYPLTQKLRVLAV